MSWKVSKSIVKTVARWPEGTLIYHPFLNETMLLEGEVEEAFIALKSGSVSAAELLDNEKLQVLMGSLDKEASLSRINAILSELHKKELVEIVSLD